MDAHRPHVPGAVCRFATTGLWSQAEGEDPASVRAPRGRAESGSTHGPRSVLSRQVPAGPGLTVKRTQRSVSGERATYDRERQMGHDPRPLRDCRKKPSVMRITVCGAGIAEPV